MLFPWNLQWICFVVSFRGPFFLQSQQLHFIVFRGETRKFQLFTILYFHLFSYLEGSCALGNNVTFILLKIMWKYLDYHCHHPLRLILHHCCIAEFKRLTLDLSQCRWEENQGTGPGVNILHIFLWWNLWLLLWRYCRKTHPIGKVFMIFNLAHKMVVTEVIIF